MLNRSLKQVSIYVLCMITLLISLSTPHDELVSTYAQTSLKVGDYVQFGKYNNQPIVWRVIHLTNTGDPLLLSDRILTLKAFDSSGEVHRANEDRLDFGSNYYLSSNIRQWLNSQQSNAGTDRIIWTQNKPSVNNLLYGAFPYDGEAGFLADGNFTADERAMIKPFTHRVVLTTPDISKREGGTALFNNRITMTEIVQNYDTAYYRMVTDSVFLLSVKQLKEFVFDQAAILGDKYYLAKPTETLAASVLVDGEPLLVDSEFYEYWLNTPDTETADSSKIISSDSSVDSVPASGDTIGVRPALQINKAQVELLPGGSGTLAEPFILGKVTDTGDIQVPTVPFSITTTTISETSVSLKWQASSDNVGVTGYVIHLNDEFYRLTNDSNAQFTLTGLKPNQTYRVKIAAFDAAGNVSAFTANISIKTVDRTPPTAPSGIKLTWLQEGQVRVVWNRATDNLSVTKYGIVRNGKQVAEIAASQALRYDLKSLPPGRHSIQIRAYDAGGNASPLSPVMQTPNYVRLSGKRVVVNGKMIDFGQGVGLSVNNGQTMVPAVAFLQALELRVTQNQKTMSVSAVNTTKKMTITLAKGSRQLKLNKNGVSSVITLQVAPIWQNGRLMIPAKAIADVCSYQFFAK
jgi:hypothetical protein